MGSSFVSSSSTLDSMQYLRIASRSMCEEVSAIYNNINVFVLCFFVLCIHQEYILDSEELSLENFISKYQDELPLHVRVCKGFYGQSERTSVSEGDTFNIHFIKKSQVLNE